jgi:hypothetical protein
MRYSASFLGCLSAEAGTPVDYCFRRSPEADERDEIETIRGRNGSGVDRAMRCTGRASRSTLCNFAGPHQQSPARWAVA